MAQTTVLVMGATGAVGSEVIRQCVNDARISSVAALTRRPLTLKHEKLREIVHEDFLDYSPLIDEFGEIDICYCALGVSQVQVGDPKLYTTITRDYVVKAAQALKAANSEIMFVFVSGAGADASESSGVLWRKVKGETENRLREVLHDRLIIVRPAYIYPIHPRENAPWQERIWSPFYHLKTVMPRFVTDTVEVARAMLELSLSDAPQRLVSNTDLKRWAKGP